MAKTAGRPVGEHDTKRQEIAKATWAVIADRGVEGASMRAIAREAGYTTGVLVHYFEDKKDILDFSFRHLASSNEESFAAASKDGDPVEVIREMAFGTLPLDERRSRAIRVWQSFLMAMEKSQLDVDGVERALNTSLSFVIDVVRRGQETGAFRRDISAEHMAEQINALVDGLCRTAMVRPKHLTSERLIDLVEAQISMMKKQ